MQRFSLRVSGWADLSSQVKGLFIRDELDSSKHQENARRSGVQDFGKELAYVADQER
ncbi:MAG: hypothetical protein ACM3OA_01570 [Acidobacteriota bacterium]